MINSRVEPLSFLFITIPLTPPYISVGPKITLIFSTLHALGLFATFTMTFVETFVQFEFAIEIGTQLIGSVELTKWTSVKPFEKTTNQLIEIPKIVH